MTIRKKTILILAIGMGVMMAISIFAISKLFGQKMDQLEIQKSTLDMERIDGAIESEVTNLSDKLADWASWDDSYTFVQDKNQAYITSNLETSASFESLRLSFIIFVDLDGKVVYEVGYDQKEKEITEVTDSINKYLVKNKYLLKFDDISSDNSGMLMLPEGLMLVSARSILTSNSEGPSKGTIIFGRLFDDTEVSNLASITKHPKINFYPLGDLNLKGSEIKKIDENTLEGRGLIKDVFDNPIAYYSVEMNRDIHLQGVEGIKYLVAILVTISLVFFGFILLLLSKLVINPIKDIAKNVNEIAHSKESVARINFSGNDEFGLLSRDINLMLDSLHSSQESLVQKSQFIETVISNLTIGIAVNNISTGKTVYVNEAFEKIYGWKKEVLTSVEAFFNSVYPDPKVREEMKERITADIKSGDSTKMKWNGIEITRSDGEKRFVDARNIPLIDQDLMVSTVMDVTDQKKNKDEEVKHTNELEKLNKLMMGRELKMVELKREIESLKKKII